MWLEGVLKEAEATAVPHELNLHFRLFFFFKSFRLVDPSFLLGSTFLSLHKGLCSDCPEEWAERLPDADVCMGMH